MLPKIVASKKQSTSLSKRQIIVSIKNTEKAVRQLEGQNILTFIIDNKAKKENMKNILIKEFKAEPIKITIEINRQGKKIARVKLKDVDAARNLAMKFGIV
ncbi:MAG: 50S ribosomal protein L23 [Candidatus Huberarchaeum crystalense]|uniref:50S ribosomal protein L23 n=1 Tax=Huberarchaeum crystalense TaxID=2014257 RepID=A0A2G9LJE5_HUBC1|nr:50S ribosomal protein L23 [archaeon]OIP20255.1 MAG: 50S ribosomal protein L23 [archaeon CG2_30_31_98]PIN66645.1 MAG: 50S ribosomal protein L23 [Candidatus Huberarchaeum crystalense]NCS98255.1 50S ribosomal protein L23 [archaeon]PIV13737.1 MAG: 50S ribosomal protein L23 [Candidatus Huberarchaeum crystalense]